MAGKIVLTAEEAQEANLRLLREQFDRLRERTTVLEHAMAEVREEQTQINAKLAEFTDALEKDEEIT